MTDDLFHSRFSSGSTASEKKADHIRMALQGARNQADRRFYYEPLFGHQNFSKIDLSLEFLGKSFRAPLWVSSMTGGTSSAQMINARLAETVARFGLGMGLGSLRPLLDGRRAFKDFDVRPLLGPECCLLGNIGIVQVDELLEKNQLNCLLDLVQELKCDGIIVHINPLQEWYQSGGDLLSRSPFKILQDFLPKFQLPVVVKEVGQGMGPQSLKALMELPLAAIELAAFGGTNFSHIEYERSSSSGERPRDLVYVGHGAQEMIQWINQMEGDIQCRQIYYFWRNPIFFGWSLFHGKAKVP